MREVIVICYGNICRSPMAEVLLQRALDERAGPGAFLVTSAGIGANDGQPPSRGTVTALADRGIDARHLRSALLRNGDAKRAWRILAMEEYQVTHARAMVPDDPDRVMLFGGEEVPDPLGSTQEAYDAVARQLERLAPSVAEALAADAAEEEETRF